MKSVGEADKYYEQSHLMEKNAKCIKRIDSFYCFPYNE